MSMSSMVLFILFFVNLGFFFLAPAVVNSPLLAFLKAGTSGNASEVISTIISSIELGGINYLILFGIVTLVSFVSGMLNPQGVLLGQSFNVVHTLTVISIALFMIFAAIPNFAVMFCGLPACPTNPPIPQTNLVLMLNMIFGFMIVMSVWGMLKNE